MKRIIFFVVIAYSVSVAAVGVAEQRKMQPLTSLALDASSKDPSRQIKITNVTLKNGMQAQIKDNQMFIIGADGKQSPAKDGTYQLMDGRKINVRGGRAIIDVNRSIIETNRSIIETN